MGYTYETQYNSPNYTPGRPWGIKSYTIHHWGADGQSHDGVVSWLCSPRSGVSANYVASAGRVTCIVDPDDRAWHAGAGLNDPNGGNATSVGIECRPEMSEGDMETVAELLSNLREVYGDGPLRPHNHWFPTACPGRWGAMLGRLDAMSREITPSGLFVAKPAPLVVPGHAFVPDVLEVDGLWGHGTTAKLQKTLGTYIDGGIDEQYAPNRQYYPGATVGWDWLWNPDAIDEGSPLIRAMQRKVGSRVVDGIAGYDFAADLQNYVGVDPDHYVGHDTISAMQEMLNKGTF